MIVASASLVAVALITLIIGLFQSGKSMIYASMTASILAFAVFIVGLLRDRKRQPETVGAGAPMLEMIDEDKTMSAPLSVPSSSTTSGAEQEPLIIDAEPGERVPAGALMLDGDDDDDDDDDYDDEAGLSLQLPPVKRARTSSAKSPARKPAAKSPSRSSSAKSPARKPAAKASARKTTAKKAAAKPTVKKPAAKKVAPKKAAPRASSKSTARRSGGTRQGQ